LKKPIPVVAAVILRGDQVLVTRRKRGGHLAGMWEFPGGKIEKGESGPEALRREILEELGCRVSVGRRMCRVSYRYPGKWVRLDFFRCRMIAGEPKGLEGQRISWMPRDRLGELSFPPADRRILGILCPGRGRRLDGSADRPRPRP